MLSSSAPYLLHHLILLLYTFTLMIFQSSTATVEVSHGCLNITTLKHNLLLGKPGFRRLARNIYLVLLYKNQFHTGTEFINLKTANAGYFPLVGSVARDRCIPLSPGSWDSLLFSLLIPPSFPSQCFSRPHTELKYHLKITMFLWKKDYLYQSPWCISTFFLLFLSYLFIEDIVDNCSISWVVLGCDILMIRLWHICGWALCDIEI